MKKLSVTAFVLAFLLLSSCASRDEPWISFDKANIECTMESFTRNGDAYIRLAIRPRDDTVYFIYDAARCECEFQRSLKLSFQIAGTPGLHNYWDEKWGTPSILHDHMIGEDSISIRSPIVFEYNLTENSRAFAKELQKHEIRISWHYQMYISKESNFVYRLPKKRGVLLRLETGGEFVLPKLPVKNAPSANEH